MWFYYLDPTMLIVLPAMIFAFWAQINVSTTFNKYSHTPTRHMSTGYDSARRILNANGLHGVRIERVSGNLTDHYDPKNNVIRLSESVYDSTGISAIGVAAHEAGHAVQYAQNYFPVKIRTAIFPVCRFGSVAAFPIFLIGLIFTYQPLMYAGIILFSLATLFQLATLPVELNASRRAVAALEGSGWFSADEITPVKKVLRAAALTYVAALASSLFSLLRLIVIAGGRRRN